MAEHHHTPVNSCIACGKSFDAATCIRGEHKPKPGDISLCLYCGHVMAFADDLNLRDLNDEEIRAVAGDPLILRAQKARGEVMKPKREGEKHG